MLQRPRIHSLTLRASASRSFDNKFSGVTMSFLSLARIAQSRFTLRRWFRFSWFERPIAEFLASAKKWGEGNAIQYARRRRLRPGLEALEDRLVPQATSTSLLSDLNPANMGDTIHFQ